MRVLHLSDLHIGLKLYNRDLLADQRQVLGEIVRIAAESRVDAVIIAGDIYDRAVPAADAVTVFDDFVTDLCRQLPDAQIMMISGNHDSAQRVDVYRHVLAQRGVHVIGVPPQRPDEHIERVTLQDEYGPVNFYLLPFVRPSMLRLIVDSDERGGALSYNDAVHALLAREDIDQSQRNVLVSHQFYLPAGKDPGQVERSESETVTVGNIDVIWADALAPFDYAALGHIHKPMKVGSEAYRYCGTPMQYSVSEAGQEKGAILVELGPKGEVRTSVIPIPAPHLVRSVRGTLAEVLAEPSEDYVRVVLTDTVDLDVLDMQERLSHAFPNLLEVTRERLRKADTTAAVSGERILDPFELCCAFLKTAEDDEQERALLQEVITAVQEKEGER